VLHAAEVSCGHSPLARLHLRWPDAMPQALQQALTAATTVTAKPWSGCDGAELGMAMCVRVACLCSALYAVQCATNYTVKNAVLCSVRVYAVPLYFSRKYKGIGVAVQCSAAEAAWRPAISCQ
jgi:hypothetical protein